MQIFGALSFCSPVLSRRHSAFSAAAAKLQWADGEYSGPQDGGGKYIAPPSSFSSVDEGKKCLQPLLLFFSQKAATFSKGPNQGRRERKERNMYIRATAAARKTNRGSLPSFSPNKIIQKASPPPPPSFMGLQNCRIMRRRAEKKKKTTGTDRPTPLPLLPALKMQLGQTDGPFPLSSFFTPPPPSCSSHRLLRYAGRQ